MGTALSSLVSRTLRAPWYKGENVLELYALLRLACHVEGMSVREVARKFGLHRATVREMRNYSVPPGYRPRRSAELILNGIGPSPYE